MPIARTPITERFWRFVTQGDGCWLWTGQLDKQGYGVIASGGKRGRNVRATHVSWYILHGYWPKFMCHTCDNPKCVRPSHLYEGSPRTNSDDRDRRGRTRGWASTTIRAKGERVRTAKMNVAHVLEIRALAARGTPRPELMRRFSLSKSAVRNIILGITWKHV